MLWIFIWTFCGCVLSQIHADVWRFCAMISVQGQPYELSAFTTKDPDSWQVRTNMKELFLLSMPWQGWLFGVSGWHKANDLPKAVSAVAVLASMFEACWFATGLPGPLCLWSFQCAATELPLLPFQSAKNWDLHNKIRRAVLTQIETIGKSRGGIHQGVQVLFEDGSYQKAFGSPRYFVYLCITHCFNCFEEDRS